MKPRTTSSPTRQAAQGGSVMVEFALGATILVALFTGIYQYGYTFYIYNCLENAVRAGARYASRETYDSPSETPSSNFYASVRNTVVYGDPNASSGSTTAPGLTTSQVKLYVTFVRNVPRTMTVSINGYSINAVMGSFTLTNKPQASMPFVGIFAPE
jgi:Flp pilus assembly protein TadG